MKKIVALIILTGFIWQDVSSQSVENSFSLSEAYEKIHSDYPIAEKIEIQRRITEFNLKIRQSGLYPNIMVNASTSYQSDVTEVPFAAPGTMPPTFSKDHYNFSVDVTQPIFDGGKVNALKKIEQKAEEVGLASIEVELHRVRSQVDQIFFGILLLKKQISSFNLLIEDIENQLKLVTARVENGVLLPGNELTLKAELLKVKQQHLETSESLKNGYQILGELVGVDLSSEPELIVTNTELGDESGWHAKNRAEYMLLDSRKKVLENQKGLLDTDKLPVLSAFAKTAYGRPGLNAFDDDLQFFWVVGLKAQWNFRNWRNSAKQKEVLTLEQKNIDADKDAFTRQLNSSLLQTENKINVLEQQIQLDKEVLGLREQVVTEKKNLLDEGAITSTEWLIELNEEHRARLNLEIHEVQLAQAKIEYQTKRGISWNQK